MVSSPSCVGSHPNMSDSPLDDYADSPDSSQWLINATTPSIVAFRVSACIHACLPSNCRDREYQPLPRATVTTIRGYSNSTAFMISHTSAILNCPSILPLSLKF